MRVGHDQRICPEQDFEGNFKTLRKRIRRATDTNFYILSFSESSLTGYSTEALLDTLNNAP